MATVTYSNEDENRFWLRMMGDNALLIHNSLTPEEIDDARQAKVFVDWYDNLVLQADKPFPTDEEMTKLNSAAIQATKDFRQFVLNLLKGILTEKYKIAFKPAILNNMITMADEYLYLLNSFIQKRQPVYDSIIEDLLWLPLLIPNAKYIADNIGYFQRMNREKAQDYSRLFEEYMLYAMELQGLTRIGTQDFPLALEYRSALENTVREYLEFLSAIITLVQNGKEIGTLSLLYLQRSNRALCYYLAKLSELSNSAKPDCNPYAMRLSSI